MPRNKNYTFVFKHEIIENSDKEIIIKIEGDFVPASRPRVSRFGTYIAEPYKSFKKYFSAYIKEFFTEYGSKFISIPLSIDISFYKELPKSYTKSKRVEALNNGCITRPDIDNYFKAVLDSLDLVFYIDDSFIVELSGRKLYSESNNYIIIKIKKFEKQG